MPLPLCPSCGKLSVIMSRTPDNSGPPANSARRVDLTQGNILRGIVLLSWPIVSGALLNWVVGVEE